MLIELVGQRRIDATAALRQGARSIRPAIRSAALTALGETVDLKGASRAGRASHRRQESPDAQGGPTSASRGLRPHAEREECADATGGGHAAVRRVPTQMRLLEILGAMGGTKALETIGAAAKSSDAELQDTGSRLLGEWMTADAAPVLLGSGEDRDGRQVSGPCAARLHPHRAAVPHAGRAAGRDVPEGTGRRSPHGRAEAGAGSARALSDMDMLKLAVKAAESPALKEDATRAALVIAQKLGDTADVRGLLAKIGLKPVKVEIIKAEYGAGNETDRRDRDAPAASGRLAADCVAVAKVHRQLRRRPGAESVKQLKVRYRIDGKEGEATFAENAVIVLPMPK